MSNSPIKKSRILSTTITMTCKRLSITCSASHFVNLWILLNANILPDQRAKSVPVQSKNNTSSVKVKGSTGKHYCFSLLSLICHLFAHLSAVGLMQRPFQDFL